MELLQEIGLRLYNWIVGQPIHVCDALPAMVQAWVGLALLVLVLFVLVVAARLKRRINAVEVRE